MTAAAAILPVSCLNLGSGKDFRPDCFNIDIDDTWNPDAVLDLSAVDIIGGVAVDTTRFGPVLLSPASFDRIIANDVLEHVPDLMALMTTCLHLLRTGGAFEISVPYDLSYGAWQDPTHVRAFNERSWLYYTDWFWYMGWDATRFALEQLQFVPSSVGEALKCQGLADDLILTTPRAIDSMSATLRKVPLSDADREVWRHWRERRKQAKRREVPGAIPATLTFTGLSPAASSPISRPMLTPFPGSWRDHADQHCIWIVSPSGYNHHQAFTEIALGLSAAFAERGGSAPVVYHPSEWAGRLPIVLGGHLLSSTLSLILPKGSIFYNFEQIDCASTWITDKYLDLLRAHPVLDYSHRNVAALKMAGIGHAAVLALGYADALDQIVPAPVQDIDVLFYGSLNERRIAVLDALRKRDVVVCHLFDVYGTERDAAVARSKIVLNMHYYEAGIFEAARVGYLLSNGACVVTEGEESDPDIAPVRGGLAICGYAEIADLCVLLLGEDEVRLELARRGRDLMRHHRQADLLGDLFVTLAQKA